MRKSNDVRGNNIKYTTIAGVLHDNMIHKNKSLEECEADLGIPEHRWRFFRYLMDLMFPLPTVGEILREEFMEPCGITAKRLAEDIHVSQNRVENIVYGGGRMDAGMSLRLAKYFGVSDRCFLDFQNILDIQYLKQRMEEELETIPTIDWHALQKEDDER